MAAAKWHRRMMQKSAKTDGQKRSETDSPKSAKTSKKVQKRSKTSEHRRKSAKTIGVLFVDRFLAIFQWPYSCGHLGFSYYWITKAKSKENLRDFNLFRKRGLLLWLVCAHHDHYQSNRKRKSFGIYSPFHYESECENKSSDFSFVIIFVRMIKYDCHSNSLLW